MNENAVIGFSTHFETVIRRIYVSKQILLTTLDNESAVHYSSGLSDNFLLAPA